MSKRVYEQYIELSIIIQILLKYVELSNQSGAKPKWVAKILATNNGEHLCMGY